MWTSAAGTTNYAYDAAGIELTQLIDPAGIVTTYSYDPDTGNLASSTHDPAGANATTRYSYGANGAQPNVLSGVSKPDGTTISFSYDADGNRTSKSVASGSTTTTVKDVYQLGLIAYETDGAGTLLATFTYDSEGVPVSVQVGADPATAPRYYYVYNGHGDVVALVDSAGAGSEF